MGFDSECDLAIEVEDAKHRATLRAFASELIGEHLARPPAVVQREIAACGLLGALDRLDGGGSRRLVPIEVSDRGACEPLPGTTLVDPAPPPCEDSGDSPDRASGERIEP
jgi:hypothetical protein